MLDYTTLNKQPVGVDQYLDTKGQNRLVIHSRVYTDETPDEVKGRIAEELYRVFIRRDR